MLILIEQHLRPTRRLGLVTCRNMSGHTLVDRPAARLETMELVISSYVLVCIVGKR